MNVDTCAFRAGTEADGPTLVFVRMAADGSEQAPARPPAHLAVALDTSSSMGGQPLMAATSALKALVATLSLSNRLGLVAFDRQATTVFEPLLMDEEGKQKAVQAIDALRPGIGTNLSEGYRVAAEMVAGLEGKPRVLLLTDGYPSIGAQGPDGFISQAQDLLAQGAITTTIGFGLRYDNTLLAEIARFGGGAYHFVSYEADLGPVLAGELRMAREIVASEARVKFVPDPGVGGLELLHHYPASSDEGGLVVEVGSVGRSHPRRLLFSLKGRGPSLGTLRISWVPARDEPLDGVVLPVVLGDPPDPLADEARTEQLLLRLAEAERRAWDALLRGQAVAATEQLQKAGRALAKMQEEGLPVPIEGHQARLDDAQQVIEGRLDQDSVLLASHAFRASVTTSMAVPVQSRRPEEDSDDG